jgi:hypothetical protein
MVIESLNMNDSRGRIMPPPFEICVICGKLDIIYETIDDDPVRENCWSELIRAPAEED